MAESSANQLSLGGNLEGNCSTKLLPCTDGFQTKQLPPNPEASPRLTNLPPELHLQIFKLLDNVTSSCLGLTCKHFYGIHQNRHGTVSLSKFTTYLNMPLQLGQLLLSWAGQSFVFHKAKPYIFVKKDRYGAFIQELHAEMQRQDRILRRVTELSLIDWEASLLCRDFYARRDGTWNPRFLQEWSVWERHCEIGVNAGSDFEWLYNMKEFTPTPTA